MLTIVPVPMNFQMLLAKTRRARAFRTVAEAERRMRDIRRLAHAALVAGLVALADLPHLLGHPPAARPRAKENLRAEKYPCVLLVLT